MESNLHIGKSVVVEMIASVENTSEERCGFLFGNATNSRIITSIMSTPNISTEDKRRHFAIDPLKYLHAEGYASHNNLELLGIFHSHPNERAVPSETDRKAAQPFLSYVILSVLQAKFSAIRSWRLNHDRLFEEEVIIQY
ncbi:MAG: M67 family metallopeptidase [Chryseolinea sp.]